MEQLTKCPCCENESIKSSAKIKDFAFSGITFNLDKCSTCGFTFTNPRPDINEIGKYYQSENYVPHHSSNPSFFHKVYRRVRNYMYTKKLSYINQHLQHPINDISLLDYGAASGDFLAYCSAQSIRQLEGVEQDSACRQDAISLHGIALKSVDDFYALPSNSFHVITLWHVLEHIHNLEEVVTCFHHFLKEDGLLVISVPNNNCLDKKIYGDYWAAYDVPRHLYHFNTATISLLMQRLGFSLEQTYPMPFDAYYIALYSEQYKKSNKILAIIRALINGFKSNIAAKKSGEYSSLTYVFRKQ